MSDAPVPTPGEPASPAPASPAPASPAPTATQSPPRPSSGYPEWDEEGLSRPPTGFEVAGILFSRWIRRVAFALALLVIVLAVVIAVPAYQVSGSDAYRAAREFVATNPEIVGELGPVQGCESVPTRYSIAGAEARFTFVVLGEGSAGVATLTLEREVASWRVTGGSFVQTFDRRGVGRVHHFGADGTAPVGSRQR